MLKIEKYTYESEENIKLLCSSFSCGNYVIDNFLKSEDCKNPSICVTYLLLKDEDNVIDLIGYFSLSADAVLYNEYNSMVPHFNGSAIRIQMFAIDSRFQGKRIQYNESENHTIASFMLSQCISIIENIVIKNIGVTYIILSSTKEGYNLYKYSGQFASIDEEYSLTLHEENGNECIDMYKPVFDLF